MMLIASVIGAWAGFFFIVAVHPANNYFIFLGLFALLGVGFGNLALLVLYRIYEWLKQDEVSKEET